MISEQHDVRSFAIKLFAAKTRSSIAKANISFHTQIYEYIIHYGASQQLACHQYHVPVNSYLMWGAEFLH